jgi:DNA-binding MarR family transcriptional regulator
MTPLRPGVEQPSIRWLSPEERDAWRSLIKIITRLPGRLDAQLRHEADLNFFEYSVLAILSEQPDRTLRMNELAAVTNATLSRLSNVVKRIEARKLVKRRSDPSDGRFTQAILTNSGMRTVVAAAPGHVEAVRELVIDAVTPTQLRQLHTVARAILERIDLDGTTQHEVHSAASSGAQWQL